MLAARTQSAQSAGFWPGQGGGPGGHGGPGGPGGGPWGPGGGGGNGGPGGGPWGPGGGPWGPGGPGNGGGGGPWDGGNGGPWNGGHGGGNGGGGWPGNGHGGGGNGGGWGHDQADEDRVRFDFRDARDRTERALDDLRDVDSTDSAVVERARSRVLDALPVAIEDLNDSLQILPSGWRYDTSSTTRSVEDARVALERASGDVRVPGSGEAARRDLEDAARYITDADRNFPGSSRGRW